MANFRCLSEHFLVEAESVCRDLMFNVLPDVNLGEIKDDLTNKGRSLSFVNHPCNRISDAYLELSMGACTTGRNGGPLELGGGLPVFEGEAGGNDCRRLAYDSGPSYASGGDV
jgi:hypothetical protein